MNEKLLQAAVNYSNDGIVVAEYNSGAGAIISVNPAFEVMSGYSHSELIGSTFGFLEGKDQEQAGLNELQKALSEGKECHVKLRNYTKEGKLFWNAVSVHYVYDGQTITHIISVNKDITQEEYSKNVLDKVNVLYREMSKRLEYTNETDSLTQLKNRGHLSTRGEFILGAAKRERLRLHAIVIDVDQFKRLNTLGGDTLGDKCLCLIADVVRLYFGRATDITIRLCDDEFVVICIEDDDERVKERAEVLKTAISSKTITDFDGGEHTISVSIGIFSTVPSKHTTLEDMIQKAGELVFQGAHGKLDQIAHEQSSGVNMHSLR